MRVMFAFFIFAAAIAAIPYNASADNMREVRGLAAMHKLGVENGRLCMTDHYHYGETGTWPSKHKAKARAVESWAGFTRLEYGNRWANFRVAAAKKINCKSKATNRGPGWTCAVEARPCAN
jgi:hypothetical protein